MRLSEFLKESIPILKEILGATKDIREGVKKLQMTNEELAQALDDLAAQLNKALGEIIAEIQGIDNVPQAVIDKLNAAKAVAQQLDDLNPDQPPPGP